MSQTVSAASVYGDKINGQVIFAKTAYVENVNETGTNLNNDVVDGDKNTKSDTKLTINIDHDNSMIIMANINGNDVIFTGIPAGRSENSNVVFFAGKSSDPKYSVMNLSYEENISKSTVYFKNHKNKNAQSATMLKLYLRVNDSSSRDYILLEAYDFNPMFDDQFIVNLPQNTLLGAWVATEFEPIDSYTGVDTDISTTMSDSDYNYYTETQTFWDLGETQTHTIKWWTYVSYSNVLVGQEATQRYRFQVYDKSMTHEVNSNLDSTSESWLHINALSLEQTSVPNTAWASTRIDGIVQDNGWSGSLSASLGVSYGLLSISFEPINFENVGYVDINNTFESYLNPRPSDGKYTRSIWTTMDSDFKLTQEGHYFYVESVLQDYGNVVRPASTLYAKWHVEIINAGNFETVNYNTIHDVPISIN
jgi:hypothetical protein